MQRRNLLQGAAALAAVGLAGCASTSVPSKARVLVVGGGYGGATAAKYIRLLSDYKIEVVLVEPGEAFVSCPISNLVLGGARQIGELSTPYTTLQSRQGVTVVRGLGLEADALAELGRELKAACGSGGTVKDGVIEIQGEHRDRIVQRLQAAGMTVKRVGG